MADHKKSTCSNSTAGRVAALLFVLGAAFLVACSGGQSVEKGGTPKTQPGSTVDGNNHALSAVPGEGFGQVQSFEGRSGTRRKPNHDRILAALQWLADHQNPRGYWRLDGYHQDSVRTKTWKAKVTRNIDTDSEATINEDVGHEHFEVGATGLALLAFLGDGHTHKKGAFRVSVKSAVGYLIRQQDGEGCFGSRAEEDYVYNHAVCTMALAELYAMTKEPKFKTIVQNAVGFILRCQNPGMGWRYGIQPRENDSSVTTWMVMALASAKEAGLKFDHEATYAGANAWFDAVFDGEDFGEGQKITGYNSPGSGNARPLQRASWVQNPTMDACNACVRLFTKKYKADSRQVRELGDLMLADKPSWMAKNDKGKMSASKIDYCYWYYGSLAAFQMGGKYWSQWEQSLIQPVLLKHQRGYHEKDVKAFGKDVLKSPKRRQGKIVASKAGMKDGRMLLDEHGSWDGLDPWSEYSGRVYTTAINALTLEVYYRYAKIGKKK